MEISEYVEFLKSKGLCSSEIMFAVSVKTRGITLTKAIYKFNELYDSGKIDGFPDSSIKVLERFYGKNLKKLKPENIKRKVIDMQKTITDVIDMEAISESVEYYIAT